MKVFVAATGLALSVRLFLLEDYRITSNSMSPNLLHGDLVFVSKMAYNVRLPFSTFEVMKFRRPQRGEVVAFTLPDRGIDTFVKRVIGVAGDKIEIKAGQVYLNGNPIVESDYKLEGSTEKISDYGPVEVPDNHFFAMGDNREDSIDSRTWGPVPYSCLKGGVKLVWLSINEQGGIRGDRIGRVVN